MTDTQRAEVRKRAWQAVVEAATAEDVEKTLDALSAFLIEDSKLLCDDEHRKVTASLLESAADHCRFASFEYYASWK